MSVAVEFAPVCFVPSQGLEPVREPVIDPPARPGGAPRRPAGVTTLRPPSAPAFAAPLRLTRRGVVVVSLLVLGLAAALLWVAKASAPGAAAGAPAGGPASVVVVPGDTLWSIAARVAPDRDPRAEVSALQRLNHLGSVQLQPGQRLRVR